MEFDFEIDSSWNLQHKAKNDKTYLEREPLEKVSKKKQLTAFKHKGFWQCMDTKRDKDQLEDLFQKKIL